MGRQRLRSARRRHGRRAIQPRAYTPRTTNSTHGLRCAPNPGAPRGAFPQPGTPPVAGWRVLDTMPEELVTSALRQALLARRPALGLLVHSDWGGQ